MIPLSKHPRQRQRSWINTWEGFLIFIKSSIWISKIFFPNLIVQLGVSIQRQRLIFLSKWISRCWRKSLTTGHFDLSSLGNLFKIKVSSIKGWLLLFGKRVKSYQSIMVKMLIDENMRNGDKNRKHFCWTAFHRKDPFYLVIFFRAVRIRQGTVGLEMRMLCALSHLSNEN